MYTATFAENLIGGTNNGWVVSCYTGASQCEVSVTNMVLKLDDADVATCQNDPRYLTWRVMTYKIAVTGAIDWARTDSYWNDTATEFGSTMGTGVLLSVSVTSAIDNSTLPNTTSMGKTFVFAYGDGSGIQFNHLTFGWNYDTGNSSAGTTGNSLVTVTTPFTNSFPSRVSDNLCLNSHLYLVAVGDTSGLDDTITQWSDGYTGKTTLELDYILPGAASGWRGVCIVYYSSQYV